MKVKKWICNYMAKALFMHLPAHYRIKNRIKTPKLDWKSKTLSGKSSEKFLQNCDLTNGYLLNACQYEMKENLNTHDRSTMHKKKNTKDEYLTNSNIIEKYNLSLNDINILNRNKHSGYIFDKNQSNCTISNDDDIKKELLVFLKKEFQALFKEVCKLTRKFEENEEKKEKILNWKFAGMVLDRFFMIIFSILTLSSTVGILLTAPNFFKMT